ncbi:esterase-like activity of phytase family protein [Saccharopolyspora griseoalba]|uniref:Esterase-like activity of phytase family protein n=1 Tax=Saccharopolyspora griseoalba TaxID=1431848 RepID=A0ABW2LPN6_9PSEU
MAATSTRDGKRRSTAMATTRGATGYESSATAENPAGTASPDQQYAYQTAPGLYLAELAVVDKDRLVALERQYVEGSGNTVRVSELMLSDDKDVTGTASLANEPAFSFVHSAELLALGDCPAGTPGAVPHHQRQPNPLLDNVEGMALGPRDPDGSRLM